MREIILVHVAGQDRPGVTANLTNVLARYGAEILDIGQAVIHDTLSLGFLVRIPPASETAPILKDLLFAAHELDLNLKFTPVGRERHERWVAAQGKARYIVTVLGRGMAAERVHRVARIMAAAGLNIDVITRLSGRDSLDLDAGPGRACIEMSVRGQPADVDELRRELLDASAELGVDIAFQEDNVFRRNRRLVAFDMDSTLIRSEIIVELAREAGKEAEAARVTEAAMNGKLDFCQSLRERVALLEGLSESALEAVQQRVELTEGAERLIANLQRFGYRTAVISGGFTWFGKRLGERLGLDYVYANELEIEEGRLTGRVKGEIVDGPGKARILRDIAAREGIDLQQVIAVGDGANDLPMLNLAGLGIAFHAKPVVRAGAEQSISTFGLDSILYLIGVRDRDTFA